MNKSNGGKQRKQHDTVIPESNPVVQHRGKPQKMTAESGEAKGLQQVLQERGFDVSGMRSKCKESYLSLGELLHGTFTEHAG
jgi:hypothetical protein